MPYALYSQKYAPHPNPPNPTFAGFIRFLCVRCDAVAGRGWWRYGGISARRPNIGLGAQHWLPVVHVARLGVDSPAAIWFSGVADERIFGGNGGGDGGGQLWRDATPRCAPRGCGWFVVGVGVGADVLAASDSRRNLCAGGLAPSGVVGRVAAVADGTSAIVGSWFGRRADDSASSYRRVAVAGRGVVCAVHPPPDMARNRLGDPGNRRGVAAVWLRSTARRILAKWLAGFARVCFGRCWA